MDYIGSDVPRRFFIELEIPTIDFPELTVTYDATRVKLLGNRSLKTQFDIKGNRLNQWGGPRDWRNVRRFYFETILNASGRSEIIFAKGNDAVVAPVEVWNYSDINRQKLIKGQQFPRRYPLGGHFNVIKPPVDNPPPVGGQSAWPAGFEHRTKNKDTFDPANYTLDEAWNVVPDSAMSVRVGMSPPDPVHGAKVFEVGGGFSPYKAMMGKPGEVDQLYLISPVDGRKIPDNDLGKGDYTSGKWIDDGFNGIEIDGTINKYIGVLNWFRGSNSYDLAGNLSLNYVRTGDTKYLDLALVVLCRIGVEQLYMSNLVHHRRTASISINRNMRLMEAIPINVLGNTGYFVHGEGQAGRAAAAAAAYDRIFPHIEKSKAIITFMQERKLPVKNHDDVKRFIEENVFLTYFQLMFDGQSNTNKPGPQRIFLDIAKMLNYPIPDFVEVAKNGDGQFFINGIMKPMLYESFCRDGVNFESPGGYNGGKWGEVFDMANSYKELIAQYPNLFPVDRYMANSFGPKLITGMESMVDHHPISNTRLILGDAGGMPVYGGIAGAEGKITKNNKLSAYFGEETADTFAESYKLFPVPKIAWALLNSGWVPPKDYPYSLEQMKAQASTLPANWRMGSRLLPGLGISLNRSGVGENERCLIGVYGNSYPGHEHDSTMGLYLDAFQNRLITQWGYPPNWDSWYRSWVTQNAGRHFPMTVDPKLHTYDQAVRLLGSNELSVDSGPLHVTDSFAELIYDGYAASNQKEMPVPCFQVLKDGWQRRMGILVDVSDKDFYVLDYYRMFGGKEHWRSIHTLDGVVTSQGLNLSKRGGTLAGENISYDDKKWWDKLGWFGNRFLRPLALFENIERTTIPDTPWSVKWDVNNGEGLKMQVDGIYASPGELNLADGRDPGRTHIVTRRFIMMHHKAETGPLQSDALQVIQAYRDAPVVKKVKALSVNGEDERGFSPVGCEITLANRVDYFILSASPGPKTMKLPNGKHVNLEGRIGYLSFNTSGTLMDMHLISGVSLTYEGQSVMRDVGVYRSKIAKVDYDKWSFDLVPAYKNPQELLGKKIYVMRGGLKIGLEVREVTCMPKSTRIRVNCDPLLFIGTSREFKDNWLVYRNKICAGSGWGSEVAGHSAYRTYFHAVLAGTTGRPFLVNNIGMGGVNLLPDQLSPVDKASLEKEFPPGCDLKVYDYGIGNEIEVPLSVGVKL